MAKHIDTLGSFEDFTAPWETESGSDAEIDKTKLKRLIYNVRADYAKARDKAEAEAEAREAAEKERDEAKAEAADANGAEAQKKIERLEKKVTDLTAERDKLVSDKEEADLRAEVLEGLDPKYAKYVKGATREELEEARKQVEEDFGLTNEPNEDGEEEDGDEDKPTVRTQPRLVRNPSDPKGAQTPPDEIDFDAVADGIVGTSIFRS